MNNTIETYATQIKHSIPADLFDFYFQYLTDERKERVLRFLRQEDKERAVIGEILIKSIIVQKLKLDLKSIEFKKNRFGKPQLIERPDFHFNLSHSGQWVICSFASEPLGADVETIKPIDFDLVHRFFSKKEIKAFQNKKEAEQLAFFYDLWTLKESYIKAIGQGLHIALDSFSMIFSSADTIRVESEINDTDFYFKQFLIDPHYKLSVCAKSNVFAPVSIKKWDQLI